MNIISVVRQHIQLARHTPPKFCQCGQYLPGKLLHARADKHLYVQFNLPLLRYTLLHVSTVVVSQIIFWSSTHSHTTCTHIRYDVVAGYHTPCTVNNASCHFFSARWIPTLPLAAASHAIVFPHIIHIHAPLVACIVNSHPAKCGCIAWVRGRCWPHLKKQKGHHSTWPQ